MTNEQKFLICLVAASDIVSKYRNEAPIGFDPVSSWIAVAGTVVSVGVGAYESSQSKKSGTGGGPPVVQAQPFTPNKLKNPATVNLGNVEQGYLGDLQSSFGQAAGYAGQVNNFNINQALSAYSKTQPAFQALQSQIGSNALSFAKGELPADTIASIGRAAAQQGITSGVVGGKPGTGGFGGGNSQISNINLRNLGLTSLDLSQMGTQLGMQVNAQAKALSPILASPTDFQPTVQDSVSAAQFNAQTLNSFNEYNNQQDNAAKLGNLSANNQFNQATANSQYAGQLAQNQQNMQALSSLTSLGSSLASLGSGASSGVGSGGGSYPSYFDPSSGGGGAGEYAAPAYL